MAIDHPDACAAGLARLAVAAMFGLVASAPAMPARAMTIAMPLCRGGVVDLPLGHRGTPPDRPGACHAACAMRRNGDATQVRKARR